MTEKMHLTIFAYFLNRLSAFVRCREITQSTQLDRVVSTATAVTTVTTIDDKDETDK